MCKQAEKLFWFKRVMPPLGNTSTAGCSNGQGSATCVNLGLRVCVSQASCPQPALALARAQLLYPGPIVRGAADRPPDSQPRAGEQGAKGEGWGAGASSSLGPTLPNPVSQTGSGVPHCARHFACTLDSFAVGTQGKGRICQ